FEFGSLMLRGAVLSVQRGEFALEFDAFVQRAVALFAGAGNLRLEIFDQRALMPQLLLQRRERRLTRLDQRRDLLDILRQLAELRAAIGQGSGLFREPRALGLLGMSQFFQTMVGLLELAAQFLGPPPRRSEIGCHRRRALLDRAERRARF